jgi:hypothetical protein
LTVKKGKKTYNIVKDRHVVTELQDNDRTRSEEAIPLFSWPDVCRDGLPGREGGWSPERATGTPTRLD